MLSALVSNESLIKHECCQTDKFNWIGNSRFYCILIHLLSTWLRLWYCCLFSLTERSLYCLGPTLTSYTAASVSSSMFGSSRILICACAQHSNQFEIRRTNRDKKNMQIKVNWNVLHCVFSVVFFFFIHLGNLNISMIVRKTNGFHAINFSSQSHAQNNLLFSSDFYRSIDVFLVTFTVFFGDFFFVFFILNDYFLCQIKKHLANFYWQNCFNIFVVQSKRRAKILYFQLLISRTRFIWHTHRGFVENEISRQNSLVSRRVFGPDRLFTEAQFIFGPCFFSSELKIVRFVGTSERK